jgi:NADH:ubiquinone oxidoreductase subunit 3 (subunit A)
MSTQQMALLIPMVVTTAMFAMVFGIFYLGNREKMAMIESGMDPRSNKEAKPINRNYVLTWGLLLVGAGVGLFLAFCLDYSMPTSKTQDIIAGLYFSLIAIFGGTGLFVAYLIEKKDNKKKEE